MSETIFSTGEAAKLIGVSHRTINNWIDSGKLRGYRLPTRNRARRVLREDLATFLQQNDMPSLDEFEQRTTRV